MMARMLVLFHSDSLGTNHVVRLLLPYQRLLLHQGTLLAMASNP